MITLDPSKNLFLQFNQYINLTEKYYNDDPVVEKNTETPNMGLINNDQYCEEVDFNNVNNP